MEYPAPPPPPLLPPPPWVERILRQKRDSDWIKTWWESNFEQGAFKYRTRYKLQECAVSLVLSTICLYYFVGRKLERHHDQPQDQDPEPMMIE